MYCVCTCFTGFKLLNSAFVDDTVALIHGCAKIWISQFIHYHTCIQKEYMPNIAAAHFEPNKYAYSISVCTLSETNDIAGNVLIWSSKFETFPRRWHYLSWIYANFSTCMNWSYNPLKYIKFIGL